VTNAREPFDWYIEPSWAVDLLLFAVIIARTGKTTPDDARSPSRPAFGQVIGYVDTHLLAGARLTADTELWTNDKRLYRVAVRLGLAFTP
jgi:hypothetical protein